MIKLLHVEDDPDIREIVRFCLDLTGAFELTQCASGEEALEHVAHHTPDLLLLDIMMPGMSGQEAFARMRMLPTMADVPAIFMTARAQPVEIDTLRMEEACSVISKPFDPLTLGDQIKSALQSHEALGVAGTSMST